LFKRYKKNLRSAASCGSRPPKLTEGVHVKRKKSYDIFGVSGRKLNGQLLLLVNIQLRTAVCA